MTGLFSTIDEKTSQEKLTGLNVNDALSIDGKTVLFAALTGNWKTIRMALILNN